MTNNPTIDGLSRELTRKQFEEKNEHRGWFVAGGRSDDTGPEGFVYEDFTTDMCWTCYFEASAALQSTIAQLQARIVDLESGIDERVEAVRFARELISTAFDGGSFDGGEIQDMAVKHGLMRIERREVECGEVCACREYGFPSDCYRTNACLDTINTPKPAEWHDVAGDDEGLVS